ncbi:GrpB family protein [Veronia nyctiphanis]|nr:GrpB family protein [Veronia nyctiphanis]
MKKSALRLLPHDPAWAGHFADEKQRIIDVANDIALDIEHIGSTSIPRIYAKPILDLAVMCKECELPTLAEALNRLGYNYRGKYGEDKDHYYAVLDRDGVRYCQLHIYTQQTPDWTCKIKFRDVLRTNDELAAEYSSYKQALAKQGHTKGDYAEIKSNWLDSFIMKVLAIPTRRISKIV